MTTITQIGFVSHLRAEPNQFILHYRGGAIVRRGAGLAYWFLPLNAAIAQLPVEDVETTFVLTERTADYQDVSVQCTLIYRVADAEAAAARINFTVSLPSGAWVEEPLARLVNRPPTPTGPGHRTRRGAAGVARPRTVPLGVHRSRPGLRLPRRR